jgi:hypothetical protein
MLRAARFASQLGFAVAPEVVAAMTAMADRLQIVSVERIADELSKLLLGRFPRRASSCSSTPGWPRRCCRAAGAAARDRRAPPAQGRVRPHAAGAGAGHRAGGRHARPGPAAGRAAARHRQAGHPPLEPAVVSVPPPRGQGGAPVRGADSRRCATPRTSSQPSPC